MREGAAFVWAGSQLLEWGGCDPTVSDSCAPTAEGYVFDPVTRTWGRIPAAPVPAAYTQVSWTGKEAIFLGLVSKRHMDGQAYDPATRTWREIALAPLRPRREAVRVWTGSELIIWGGSGSESRRRGGPAARGGAAYDPSTNTWRRIAPAPHGLNLASGMWTGREVLVFGSLLNGRNIADTPTSVGAAYDPVADTWRSLPASALSPQATSAVWLGNRMLAWDYNVHSQVYDPASNTWSAPAKMPLQVNECYPDSVVVGDFVFAFFCGQAALYDVSSGTWQRIHGGMLGKEVWSDAYKRDIKLWRFADMVSTGDVALFAAQGITLTHKGVACYGCSGSPTSFWAYRPSATASRSPTPTMATESRRVVGGITLQPAPTVVAEQCQHAANPVGYPVPCPRLLPFETRPYPHPPSSPFVHQGFGPYRTRVFGNMVFPAAGTRSTMSQYSSQGHLVISAAPKGSNLRHLLYGVTPDPRYDHVVRQGTARVQGVRGEFIRVLATNTESIFMDHLVLVWSSGGHLYAVGFHRVNQASRALDLAVARSIVLVPPVR